MLAFLALAVTSQTYHLDLTAAMTKMHQLNAFIQRLKHT